MPPPLQFYQSAREPRPRGRPRKRARDKAEHDGTVLVEKERIRVEIPQYLLVQLRSRID